MKCCPNPFDGWRAIGLFVPVLAALAFPGLSPATSVLKLNLDEAVEMAEIVVAGQVVSRETGEMSLNANDKIPATVYTFDVLHVYVGEGIPESITLVNPGGGFTAKGTYMPLVEGFPDHQVGETLILLLEQSLDETYVVTGLHQGKYHVASDAAAGGAQLITRSKGHANLVRKRTAKRAAGEPELPPLQTLEQFENRLQTAALGCGKQYHSRGAKKLAKQAQEQDGNGEEVEP